jgi:hypothetical protein
MIAEADPAAVAAASSTAATAIVIAITGMVTAVLGPFLMSWINGRQRAQERADDYRRQDEVAKRLENAQEIADKIAKENSAKLDKVVVTGAVTHSLVNSAMGAQKKLVAIALRRVADLSQHSDDIKAAELAEQAYIEHEENAKKVNAAAVL